MTQTLADKRAELRRLMDLQSQQVHPFTASVNPRVGQLLHGLGLDVEYVRGEGTALFDAGGRIYLDFAGAYGALPFGHNPPQMWSAITTLAASGEPSLTQPSLLGAAGLLAQRLTELAPAGLRFAWFCNSGAEAVEAAIKLARGAQGRERRCIVSTHDSFHGKTLGALSATGRHKYQEPFAAPAGGFAHVPFGDLDAATSYFEENAGQVAAFIVEPIQGEGGINPAPPGYLAGLRALCDTHDVLLIVDEVQTGLGRTGTMFAIDAEGVVPDIITVAKALGGGLVPIGAVLFGDRAANEDFALRHTSTFGGNAFCSRVGIASLELLTANNHAVVANAATRGRQLGAGLARIAAAYPTIVSGVRGRGLLWGVELTSDSGVFAEQGLFRSLADAEGIVGFLCGHLLREHGIRVAPTYFSGRVLRVEPALTVTAEECARFLGAVDQSLSLIAAGESSTFFRYLTGASGGASTPARATYTASGVQAIPVQASAGPAAASARAQTRWAFLAHPTDATSYASFDRRLGLDGDAVRRLFDRMNACRNADSPAGMLLGPAHVVMDDGSSTRGEVFALGYNARDLIDMPNARAVALVRRAVLEAIERGAQIVGLGAYTSIVTANGVALGDVGASVTTGNAYTVASAVDGLLRAGATAGHDSRAVPCSVLGATGNIGRAAALLLSERVGRLVLCGNPATPKRSVSKLSRVARDVVDHLLVRPVDTDSGELHRRIHDLAERGWASEWILEDLTKGTALLSSVETDWAVAEAPLVLVSTSTPESVIHPHMPRQGAVICDVSQPPNVGGDVRAMRPDLTVVSGGLVRLPAGRDLGVDFGLPPGVTYACTAETLIAAAQIGNPILSCGEHLDPDLVRAVGEQGRRLGFSLHLGGPR